MDEGLAKIRGERSKKDFPFLRLEEGEYVEYAFRRARTVLLLALGGLGAGLIVILLAFLLILMGQEEVGFGDGFLYGLLGVLVVVVGIAAVVEIVIYRGNRLFVTNRHVIQMTMTAPMASSMNMIDLSSIEDVSFHQNGFLQKIFGFGTLRLSTVGDETTYTFKDADVTGEEMKGISKLVSEAKNSK